MKTLLHICCAPCSVSSIEMLMEKGIEPVGFWYNPTIHPVTEYRARRDTLINYAKEISMPLEIIDEYGLRDFVRAVVGDIRGRCEYCYRVRLEKTAEYAKEKGFDSFTTTLLVSPYQNRDLILKIGRECEEKYGVKFLSEDFRIRFREGQDKAREMGFYMQKYCGCIFSEEDRYLKTDRKEAK